MLRAVDGGGSGRAAEDRERLRDSGKVTQGFEQGRRYTIGDDVHS